MPTGARELDDAEYVRLLDLRTGLRRFLHWSEMQARAQQITPAHHQLLLAIRGSRVPGGPTIGDVSDALVLRHHSVVGLVDRAVDAGLVERRADRDDQRVVRLALTPLGARRLRQLSRLHLEELRRLAPQFRTLWAGLDASTGAARGT
jgi:DNA-binding MarR family transcriptional regulator